MIGVATEVKPLEETDSKNTPHEKYKESHNCYIYDALACVNKTLESYFKSAILSYGH